MASIKFGGINTGLPPNLVEQLVAIERLPIQTVEQRKAKTENRLNLVNELAGHLQDIRGNLDDMVGIKGFTALKVDSGDPSILTGAVDPGSGARGSWNIEVLELASKAGAVTNGFPDKDQTQVGIGYISFKTPEGEKEVFINRDSSTLQGVASQINASGLGVRASVINDRSDPDRPFRLIITGNEYGDDAMVDFPTLYFLDGDQDFYFDQDKPAKNARVKVDGFELELPDNKIDNLVDGLTIDLRQAAPGKIVNVKVSEDQEVVEGKLDEWVKSMNKALSFIQQQNSLTAESDTTGTLGGDGLLRSIENDLRRLIQDPVMGVRGSVKRLNQLGIEFNREGTLNFSKDKFNKALISDSASVQAFLLGDGFNSGFVPRVRRKIGQFFDGSFGLITNRRNNLERQIRNMDDRIDSIERRVAQKEKTLRRKFGNLEEKISQMKSQGNFLAARLGGPSGASNINLSGATLSQN